MRPLKLITKTGLFIILMSFILSGVSMAQEKQSETRVLRSSPCKKGYMNEDKCFLCHTVPNNKLKEANPDETRNYPVSNMVIRGDIGYYTLEEVNAVAVWRFFDYLENHNVKKAVFEIMSPGGSLFVAWTIVSYMRNFPGTVETRVRSYAASAGCLIFVGGDIGKRYISKTAMLMWHELWTFEFLSIKTPSSTEDEAKTLRKFQDNTNQWLADRTNLSKAEIDEKVKRKEFWINGKEALEYGFADGIIQK